jgi:hypothetical protein
MQEQKFRNQQIFSLVFLGELKTQQFPLKNFWSFEGASY